MNGNSAKLTVMEKYRRASFRPWQTAVGPQRMSPHVWYVGDAWIGSLIVITADGVILIDSGIRSQTYLLFEAIRELGMRPRDIRHIFITHAHLDHTTGVPPIVAYTGAEVWASEAEADWYRNSKYHHDIDCDIFEPINVDHYYDYNAKITHGNFVFQPVFTPGHTPGTTSFFFSDRGEDGKLYRLGLHGGTGLNTLTDSSFQNAREAHEARKIFRDSLLRIRGIPVDICITNHPEKTHMLYRISEDSHDFSAFVDAGVWPGMIDETIDLLDDLEKSSIFHDMP